MPLYETMISGVPDGYFSFAARTGNAPLVACPGPWAAANNTAPTFVCPANIAATAQDQQGFMISYYNSITNGYTLEIYVFELAMALGVVADPSLGLTTNLGPTNYLGVAGFMGSPGSVLALSRGFRE